MTAPVRVAVGAATHAGLRRRINEDSYLAEPPLFLVADGMGGHAAGDVASAMVVEEFGTLAGARFVDVDDMTAAFDRARRRVDAITGGVRPAGTTLSGVAVSELDGAGYWLAVNIGDSRTYRLAHGELEQLTTDHSVVQELIESGHSDEASATGRNVITRAIGGGSSGPADYWMIPACRGDRMLVCSDGLSNELRLEDLRLILQEESDPRAAAVRLVREAMVNGGNDNITAVVVDALEVARPQGVVTSHPGEDGEDEDTAPRPVQGTYR